MLLEIDKKLKDYYNNAFIDRIKFFTKYKYFYSQISNKINNLAFGDILFVGLGHIEYLKNFNKKVYCKEISEKFFCYGKEKNENIYKYDENDNNLFDQIFISTFENDINPLKTLQNSRKLLKSDGKIIIIKNNLFLHPLIKFFEKIGLRFKYITRNIITENFLINLLDQTDLEVIEKKDYILFPFYLPFFTSFINNFVSKLPLLRNFCLVNILILRKKINEIPNKELIKVSIVIPCKNEEKNIDYVFNSIPDMDNKIEVLFGNDNSTDNTKKKIYDLISNNRKTKLDIIYYDAPGISKSENVYKGFDLASGEILLILDADNTVHGSEIINFIELIKSGRYDFINGTRFIYPMESNAMKKFNFIGNVFFSFLISNLFNLRITDTLCGTKVLFKKDWLKIRTKVRKWGVIDKWGDFDLLFSAKYFNLKIGEHAIKYKDRVEGQTKMTSVIGNGLRMLGLVLSAKLKILNDK